MFLVNPYHLNKLRFPWFPFSVKNVWNISFQCIYVFSPNIYLISCCVRCFYIAEVLAGLRRWREAGAMYQRAESYARTAQSQVAGDMRSALAKLIEEVDGARYSSLAHAVLEADGDAPAQQLTSKSKKKVGL